MTIGSSAFRTDHTLSRISTRGHEGLTLVDRRGMLKAEWLTVQAYRFPRCCVRGRGGGGRSTRAMRKA
jgi:hypothetical protein